MAETGLETPREQSRWRVLDFLPGLGIALCFSISAILVRNGLNAFPSPLLGVTIGMFAAVVFYGGWLFFLSRSQHFAPVSRRTWVIQLLAGLLIGLGTWARYIAMDLTEIGIVLALGRINTPLVLLLSPLLFGRKNEPVTLTVWLGAGLIVIGSLVLIFAE
jgi:uncharacterized membrane protein